MTVPPRVNFIGIGAQKCASSWVHKVLAEHPQACLSSPKELDYFSYFYGRGHDWYERFFAPTPGALAIGDNSPSYLVHPLAPARAARYNPELRIVVALRDPIERAFSNHLHMVREGFLTGPDLSFEYGLARNEMYVEQSRYATHLSRWLDHFPRRRVHVVLQEDLAGDNAAMTAGLYAFLGLDPSFVPTAAGERANESSVARHPGVDGLLHRGASILRRAGLGRVVGSVKASPAIRRLRHSNQVNLREMVPPMLPATRERLREALSGEILALPALLGRHSLPWRSWQELQTAAGMPPEPSLEEAIR